MSRSSIHAHSRVQRRRSTGRHGLRISIAGCQTVNSLG
jgi:hypothetical protein